MSAIASSATFSPCRTWRYALRRDWSQDGSFAMFIGLNPSTADETENDPTIRRCIRFALDWGYGGLVMTNLFAFRSTDPRGLLTAEDPVGPDNDPTLVTYGEDAGVIVAAWGTKALPGRAASVTALLGDLHALRVTKDGHPSHPLYLPASLTPQPFP